MSFGNKIRLIREERRITAKAMADYLDIDLATLNRIENNRTKSIKPQLLIQISEYLKVGVADLLDMGTTLQPSPDENVPNSQHTLTMSDVIRLYEQLLKSKDRIIEVLQRENDALRKK
ncbi:helix-turn-helix protein [Dyadobacter jejuensis]|uniref:Helix-turn-helix protein n=1 Tax=Dyadobacter jejuensis TaxID=1082580 RepID=A0A316AFT1_9BACT|nr:helix-turn-helix transcriptional regulator [Dyadobacter jejuensis]PWJ56563.1 helix-turn-helix protein [Dyadobacter jejuensis]